MANYGRGGQTFRSLTKSGVEYPVLAAGAQPRTYYTPQSITSTTGSQTLTVPSGAEFADIYCDSATDTDYVRFWHGGAVPTASVGVKLKAHEVIQSADPATFRFIASSGTPALRVEYYAYL